MSMIMVEQVNWEQVFLQSTQPLFVEGVCLISIYPPQENIWPLLCSGPAAAPWCSAGFFC